MEYLETISQCISETLEGISEAFKHIQEYFRGYSDTCMSPVYIREFRW